MRLLAPSSIFIVTATTLALVGVSAPAQALTSTAVWDRVASCEATGNWGISTGNGFYGGLQFTSGTWAAYGGRAYASQANLASRAQQIAIGRKVLAGQGPGAWPVCSVRAGLTRANGGATSLPVASHVVGKLTVDGVMGPKTQAAMNAKGIRLTTLELRRSWQAKLHVKVDGVIGPVTIRAIQTWCNLH